MSSYETSMQAQIASLRSKRDTAERSVKAALEAHNSDPSNNHGYNYYTAEMGKIPERREAALLALERKQSTFNSSRQSQINKLEEEIEVYKRKKEAEINMLRTQIEGSDAAIEQAKEATASKYDSQVKEYNELINGIVENLSEPKSQVYQRNKKQVEILSEEIAKKTADLYDRMDQESARKMKALQEQQQAILRAEKRAEDEKKERDREAALRNAAIAREAEERRLTENEKKPPRAATPEPVKRVLKKFSSQSKTIAEMTQEEADEINPLTVPEHLLDEWMEKFPDA